ncbi:mechanosensitive ion channel family protein [Bacillus solimangrovi]|uniref:Mechanosensitive ion channel protein n=1 Tax=Bacillus solimangrovi TaxID=1305675 RepID=A0A1E5LK41_9BACI|nr:mechanosensitive ion channel family protein [Bacillus solimangrovi]OEH94388.1 mechanosensitive ion channel protein [Bacillus solimangrovi]
MNDYLLNIYEIFSSIIHKNIYIDIAIALLILLVFLLIRKIIATRIIKASLKLTSRTKTNLDDNIVRSYEKPLRVFIIVIGLYLACIYLPLETNQINLINKVFKSMIIVTIFWGIYNLTNSYSTFIVDIGKRMGLTIDELLVPFLTRITRPLILLCGVTIIADLWNYNISVLVTGLGIGGLAFALAAQDALKNIFGGVIIITEKPFKKGDWIQTPSVEGTVEGITFRSTLIRTFAQALVTIPNSKLSNEAITNWTKMGKRRITFNLGVEYRTPKAKIERVIFKIEQMLKTHEEIDQETIFVKFNEFSESSLDIFLYFFTKTTNWEKWLDVKQDCNLRIIEILEEEGVQIAFPSQSLYFENDSQQYDNGVQRSKQF